MSACTTGGLASANFFEHPRPFFAIISNRLYVRIFWELLKEIDSSPNIFGDSQLYLQIDVFYLHLLVIERCPSYGDARPATIDAAFDASVEVTTSYDNSSDSIEYQATLHTQTVNR